MNKEQFISAGTEINFKNASAENFGSLTLVEGVLDIVYFDGTTALTRMGKFPVLSATAVTDATVIIDNTELEVSVENGIGIKSGTNHTHWSEKSCWQ